MLTCDICGEQILMEEDMKTHLLLSHLENDMHCPLCFLSGVSYDELCFHISAAHPEKQQDPTNFTSTLDCSAGTNTDLTENEKPQTAPKLFLSQRCTAGEAVPTSASDVQADSAGKTAPITSRMTTQSPITKQKSVKHCNEENNGITIELNEAKQKQLSSQGKGEKISECPVCSVICVDSFSLQEHVELHLDHWETVNSEESPGTDLKLARQLQQEVEEEQRRKQERTRKEREEFKKLQSQFGLDGRGGYRRQMERTMEKAVARGLMDPSEFHSKRAKMMESLATGVDDGNTITHGVVRALYEYYQTECRDCAHVWLSADTDHYGSSVGDKGWGCGYRNFQMLLSSLHRIDMYASFLQGAQSHYIMPDLKKKQCLISLMCRK